MTMKREGSVSSPWRVVIIGGGFGGLCAAQTLKSDLLDVTLIDRRNYHLFQPLLYQVATGSLSPGQISAPLPRVLSRQKNTRVLLGSVEDVDPDSKQVFLEDGAVLPYDSLIVATGSQTSYFGHDNWQEWAPGLKSIEEATTIRHKILHAFEVAERIADPVQRRAWLTFVIVGAGPTGVELAGAIAEIARQTLKNDFRYIRPEESQIILLDGAPRVLMPFPEDLAEKAKRSLVKLSVTVRCGTMVKEVDQRGLTIETEKELDRIEARTVIWAGGITASSLGEILARRTEAETDKGGRIKVKSDLTIPNYSDILCDRRSCLFHRRPWKIFAGIGASGDAGWKLCGQSNLAKGEGPAGTPCFPVLRQRLSSGHWTRGRSCQHLWPSTFWNPCMACLGVYTPDVHCELPESTFGFPSVGHRRPDFQPWSAALHWCRRD